MLKFLEENKLLANEQHGFVPKKSFVTNLLKTLDFVTEVLAEGELVDVIYLDFAKAFDTVPHKRLLKKLKAHGSGEVLVKWFESV